MTETKKDEKKSKQRKSRAKVKSAKDFLEVTKSALLANYTAKDQNVIVKELYFAVRDNRIKLIKDKREEVSFLEKLNEDIPVSKS